MPIRDDVLDQAFATFRETGELPDEERFANAVTECALHGEAAGRKAAAPATRAGEVRLDVVIAESFRPRAEPSALSPRDYLFDEAVYGPRFIREVARFALLWQAQHGVDLTDPEFLADWPLPAYGSIGLSLLGYPERLWKPPYEEQGRRLFERYSALLEQVDHESDAWLDAMAHAAIKFERTGELPADGQLRQCVLANAEMAALERHARGGDVGDLMALLDKLVQGDGEEQEEARRRVCAMAAVRQLV